jgi:hypothetical protein
MSKKLTTEEFIERAKKIHGDAYDYSKVNYIKYTTKVKIICPIHGEFEQTPESHLKGKKCNKCYGRNLTTQEFIDKANLVHNNRYDYSKVNYKNGELKIDIICSLHGSFKQSPHTHLLGRGCPKCANKDITIDEFITKANLVHNNKYYYSKFTYINAKTKGVIICPKHGEFWQIPNSHLLNHGCPECAQSKIESKDCILIEKYLIKNSYKYIKEKTFIDCKSMNSKELRFDFYLVDKNILIEYNGEQHYKFINYFHRNIKGFYKQIERDIIKFLWAKENNIGLLTIKYNDYKNEKELNLLLKERIMNASTKEIIS